jgi:hypothetical protein
LQIFCRGIGKRRASRSLPSHPASDRARSACGADRVHTCFMLARTLIGRSNYPLAALALSNAELSLESYATTASIADHSDIVRSMKMQIEQIRESLKQRAI